MGRSTGVPDGATPDALLTGLVVSAVVPEPPPEPQADSASTNVDTAMPIFADLTAHRPFSAPLANLHTPDA